MTNKFNQTFIYLFISISLLVCLLSACQQENKPVLNDQQYSQSGIENKNQNAKASPKVATEQQTAAKKPLIQQDVDKSIKANEHMVVAANPLAARAGIEILKMGGSAIDAAIATQLALNVVEPQSSGVGGGADRKSVV